MTSISTQQTASASTPLKAIASLPIRVGLVGTGYAADLRAKTLQAEPRSRLIAVAGHTPEKTTEFAQSYEIEASVSWRKLVEREDLDLIIIANISRDHDAIAQAALEADKHVIVEYPLAFDPIVAEKLIALAAQKGKLLHVEHIELLGGLHQGIQKVLPQIEPAFYIRYVTISPKHPAPRKWTYHRELFGFPFIGALSRLQRLTDLFGEVTTVTCQNRYWDAPEPGFYQGCLCSAQLNFRQGAIAEVVYGKGEIFWESEQTFTIYGEKGTLIFTPEVGHLIQGDRKETIPVGSRRGLFAQDTKMVIDHLIEGIPLYITPAQSLYALKVADATRQAAETGQLVTLQN